MIVGYCVICQKYYKISNDTLIQLKIEPCSSCLYDIKYTLSYEQNPIYTLNNPL